LRTLVVEDHDEISEAMSFYCSAKKDIECNMINNGRERLERIRNDKFDLVLLDLAIPDFSGWDVIKSLHQDGFIKSNNIVIFTASSDQIILNDIRDSDVKDVFKKTLFVRPISSVDREISS